MTKEAFECVTYEEVPKEVISRKYKTATVVEMSESVTIMPLFIAAVDARQNIYDR